MDAFESLRKFDSYLDVTGRSPATRGAYRYALTKFMAEVMKPLPEVDEDDVVGYLAGLPARGSGRTDATKALRAYFAWAEERGFVRSPVRRIATPRRKYGKAPSLTLDEVTRMLIALSRRDPRRAWTALLLYATGVRVGSLVEAIPADVDGDWIAWRVTKGDRPYRSPLGPYGRAAVDELLVIYPGSGTLVQVGRAAIENWLRAAGQECGFRCHPHLLRHTYLTHLAESGADPDVMMRLAGHADMSMLPRYITTSDDRKVAAVGIF